MADKTERENIEAIAKRLAEQHGYGGGIQVQLQGGFAVPFWVTFLSRAEQLWKERGI